MAGGEEAIDALREALRVSPDNVPLRRHLAETLAGHGRYEEAESEYRRALTHAPNDDSIKLSLAQTYYQQEKNSHALVIVEEFLKRPDTPPRAYLLHARLLVRAGDVARAVRQYRQARQSDPGLADSVFEEQLGIDARDDSDVSEGRLRGAADAQPDEPMPDLERPSITFQDVGGMEAVKDEIRLKIIHPLTHPEIYEAYGKKIGGGILLYGPPGCGKTYLARATAGEVKAGFLSVGINDVLEMWIGQSERNLHQIFETARAHRPCVLFFDEVDALGASRTDMRHSSGRHLINQFLAELDGDKWSNEGILILAATNAPWHLDSAFRRPGRFDRILFVPPPDASARAAILRILLHGKPTTDINFDALVKKTADFSGADLKALVDTAVESKLRAALGSGTPTPIQTADLIAAARNLKPTTTEWFATARNYAVYANQAGLYDEILKYLRL
ncbi:MAG: AAA family ATPase [Phycisphaerae bacterium]|nr:AAA family ATPase [Phycisphaerae bacterium]